MGMYTEIYICTGIKQDIKDIDLNVLKFLFMGENKPDTLPSHRLFSTPRWHMIGSCSSHYHIPYSTSDMKYNEIAKQYFIVSRSDLKNYNDDIELFFDWIMPFLNKSEGEFIGYSRYEETNIPKLYFKLKGKTPHE